MTCWGTESGTAHRAQKKKGEKNRIPKVLTPTKRQEIALLSAIERGKLTTGFHRDQDVAAKIGLHQSTYSNMKKDGFRAMRLFTLRKMARVLQLTPREVCDALGVPYSWKEG